MDKPLPEFHGNHLRRGRVSIPGQIYMVTVVTQDRKPIFDDFSCGRILIEAFRFHEQKNHSETLTFVVMPDHFHWLFSLGETLPLSKLIATVKRVVAKQINAHLNSQGQSIWQKGFHDHALRKEEDIKKLSRYIVANPLRAGLVDQIGDYSLWDAKWL